MNPEALGDAFQETPESTIVDVVRWHAINQPHRIAYTFLSCQEKMESNLTFEELDSKARAIAVFLSREQMTGRTALLLLPSGLEFVTAFFGCLYGGIVPIPGFPVRTVTAHRGGFWFRSVARDANPGIAFVECGSVVKLQSEFQKDPATSAIRLASASDLSTEAAAEWKQPACSPVSLAFLQYTSGSTSLPKGVMVSHGNIMHNQRAIRAACGQSQSSILASWLPLHHDMGLVGSVLQPAYLGARSILMAPSRFLQNPASWLRAISIYRATSSSAPNFAYDLCTRRVTLQEKKDLNLASWRVAVNGAEPVRFDTMRRFTEAFSECGFSIEAFRPSYGLAEATLMVTGSRDASLPMSIALSANALAENIVREAGYGEATKVVVGCGFPVSGTEIKIIDPKTLKDLPERLIGEIWVGGQSVAGGYWNGSGDDQRAFEAVLGKGLFFRTGDLGFLVNGQLFVTGRLKDLIIVHGRNFYPQDVELTVLQASPDVSFGCAAAFTLEAENREDLVVICEVDHHVKASAGTTMDAMRQAIALEHGIVAHIIVLVRRGTLPKTTSGKVKRSACRQALILGDLEIIASKSYGASPEEMPQDGGLLNRDALHSMYPDVRQESVENYLKAEVSRLLKLSPESILLDQPLVALGLDSLLAFELSAFLLKTVEVKYDPIDLLQDCSLEELTKRVLDDLFSRKADTTHSGAWKHRTEVESPLSYGQQALLSLHRLAPSSAAYNVAGAAYMRSELNVPALRAAFKGVMVEHAALRSIVRAQGDEVFQFAQSPDHMNIDAHFECREGPKDTSSLVEQLTKESRRPFTLEQAPPIRLSVFRQSATEHVLLLVVHHIIVDFWSVSLILRSLGDLYLKMLSGDKDIGKPANTTTYRDFVLSQRELVDSPEGDELCRFWKRQLSPEVPILQLPSKLKLALAPRDRGAVKSMRLESDLSHRLEALGRRLAITPFVVCLAAFQVLLHRLSNQNDLAVAVPTSGRNHPRFVDVVGYFVNPVAIRSRYCADLSCLSFIEQTKRTVLDAMRHADYPFPLVVEHLHPQRIPSAYPICQAMFVWQKSRVDDRKGLTSISLGEEGTLIDLNGLLLESIHLEPTGSQFELTLTMGETESGLAGTWKYSPELFDATTIHRIAGQFSVLLEGIAKNPEERIDRLPIVSDTEHEHLLHLSRPVDLPDLSTARCVHELIEDQAARRPNSPALMFRETSLSFGQVNAQANQFARYLRNLGVTSENRVGLFLERSVELIVALLGIWKAGAAYVPLDINDPKARITSLIEQSSMNVLITHESLLEVLPDQLPQTILLDLDLDPISQERDDNPNVGVPMESLAYVIYTSGSTGQPKGVMIEHRSLINLLSGLRSALYDQRGEETLIVGLNAPLSFDSSVKQVITLALGHTLYLLTEEIRKDAFALRECMEQSGLHMLDCTPSQVQLLMETGFGKTPNTVSLLVGGEPISHEMWEYLAKSTPARCYNLYGPTECTVDATLCSIQNGEKQSIGRPLNGTQIFLLDEDLCPVPIGATGEIVIGGLSVSRGYLRRPELTAEKFVPDPFGSRQGGRLYKTGDRAQWLPDGTLKIIGRLDRQAKIRGFRIELGEVEAILCEYPGVSEAAVAVRDEGNGNKYLLAYVVSDEKRGSHEYRRFLAQKLPKYMVPTIVVTLSRMPTSSNGKRDYSVLPIPENTEIDRMDDFAPPCSVVEKVLAELWSDALHVSPIGIHDNFFSLGGNSLQATRLITRIQEKFQSGVPLLALFFQDPTIAGLANALLSAGTGELYGLSEQSSTPEAN
jgi:amino acid adenylation domain-containing protein